MLLDEGYSHNQFLTRKRSMSGSDVMNVNSSKMHITLCLLHFVIQIIKIIRGLLPSGGDKKFCTLVLLNESGACYVLQRQRLSNRSKFNLF